MWMEGRPTEPGTYFASRNGHRVEVVHVANWYIDGEMVLRAYTQYGTVDPGMFDFWWLADKRAFVPVPPKASNPSPVYWKKQRT